MHLGSNVMNEQIWIMVTRTRAKWNHRWSTICLVKSRKSPFCEKISSLPPPSFYQARESEWMERGGGDGGGGERGKASSEGRREPTVPNQSSVKKKGKSDWFPSFPFFKERITDGIEKRLSLPLLQEYCSVEVNSIKGFFIIQKSLLCKQK